eukprot:TRINITY_DN100603_c0_g1_i1.p1 TRINITY_DN100603_c0_g1~~TRINITY_DN100603_c0_g1_i1.p1  ORF type:complete len:184 (+),score=36.67 TRINITY_DN100603_c0_g1_i1:28-579(+)
METWHADSTARKECRNLAMAFAGPWKQQRPTAAVAGTIVPGPAAAPKQARDVMPAAVLAREQRSPLHSEPLSEAALSLRRNFDLGTPKTANQPFQVGNSLQKLLEDAEAVSQEPQMSQRDDGLHTRARDLAVACTALGRELERLHDHLGWAESLLGVRAEAGCGATGSTSSASGSNSWRPSFT